MFLVNSDDSWKTKRTMYRLNSGRNGPPWNTMSCPRWNMEDMLTRNRKQCDSVFFLIIYSSWTLVFITLVTFLLLKNKFMKHLTWVLAGELVRTEVSVLSCGTPGVFHKVNLAKKHRLHTLPHPIIPARPSLLSSYKRLSRWCSPHQQLC